MENNKHIVKWRNLFLILLIASLQACTKRPTAEIRSSKTEANTNENINFLNTSKDAESYLWEFGDGTTSEEPTPTKAFSKPGIYSVKFTAFSNGKEKTDEAMLIINVVENKTINSYFVGEYELDVTYMDSCLSDYHTYKIKIREGNSPDEVFIDNLTGKHIDGVRAKVMQVTTGHKLVTYADQLVQDNLGNQYRLVAEGDFTAERIDGNQCLMVNGKLQRIGAKDSCLTTYIEEGADCP